MKFPAILCLGLAACWSCSSKDEISEPPISAIDQVDVFTGTGGLGWAVGSIPPGPMYPFAMARPGPDTSTLNSAPNFSHCAGYWYEDKELRGFSQLHLSGTGVPDYGVLMIMPALELSGPLPISERNYSQTLDHDRELARVGRYSVTMMPSRIKVEIGATLRTALYRITYPEGQAANLLLDLDHGLNGTTVSSTLTAGADKSEISGSFFHHGELVGSRGYEVHFVLKVDRPFKSIEQTTRQLAAAVDTSSSRTLNVQIGISFIDVATARANLDSEFMNWDLDAAETATREAWTRALAVIQVKGGTEAHRRRFYSALYNFQQMPTLFTEAGGKYRGLDKQVHDADGFTYYTDLSLWDTFRTFHPLITLLRPDIQRDFSLSMLRMTEQTGRIPKWPLATAETDTMIGYHGETVLVDGFLKGVEGIEGDTLWSHFRAAAFLEPASARKRDCISDYLALGYCPVEGNGRSASVTLENAFADFVLAKFARKIGRDEDAALLETRAGSWRPLVNTELGWIQGRNADGTFTPGFSEELFAEDFAEGNTRQWTTFVPHDVPGLAEAFGGREPFVAKLQGVFDGAVAAEKTALPDLWYWHGNEPDIHAPYMFAELGRSDLTERYVDWIIDARYPNGPAGLDGNDDGGTLSAWYVFSALGFYPKVGENRYVLGKPLFDEAVVALPGGTLTVRAIGLSESAIYVKKVELNGVRLAEPFVSHEAIAQGGELVFEMSETPVLDAY